MHLIIENGPTKFDLMVHFFSLEPGKIIRSSISFTTNERKKRISMFVDEISWLERKEYPSEEDWEFRGRTYTEGESVKGQYNTKTKQGYIDFI
jgi:hypothetical protein